MTLRIGDCSFVVALALVPALGLAQERTKPTIDLSASKESLHDELRSLAARISELRASQGPAARIEELQERYAAISHALGGDDPAQLLPTITLPGASQGWGLPAYLVAPTPCAGMTVTTANYAGGGGPILIPQPYQAATFTTTVSGAGPYLWDVNLTTFITHTSNWNNDITLESPAGTIVTITTDNGGLSDNVFNGTLWDDNVNIPCVDYVYANLVVAPQLSPEGRLAAFRGEDPNGVWTLRIIDDAALDTGNLSAWSLDIRTLASAPVEATTTLSSTPGLAIPDSATVQDTLNFSGLPTYLEKVVLYLQIPHTESQDLDIRLTSPGGTIVDVTTDNGLAHDDVFHGTTFDPDVLDPVTDHAFTNLVVATLLSPEGSFDNFLGQDPNGVWTLTVTDDLATDLGTLVRWDLSLTSTTPPSPSATVNYAGTSGPLPDNGTTTTAPSLFTTVVSGAGTYLWDVDLTTAITHTAGADLDMQLTSPAGTSVIITTDNGGTFDDVYNGTLWDDNANAPATDYFYVNLALASPLSPEGRLTAFRGENPNGVWTLTIEDDAVADTGSLGSWSMDLSTITSAPGTAALTFTRTPGIVIPSATANTVFDVMPLSGLPTSIAEIELYLEITHSFAADLDITLTSPMGTVVTVTTDNGGILDNVYNGTLFDGSVTDTVTEHVYVNLVTAPLLSPEGAFDNFLGQDPNGNWTLTVADDTVADGGIFARWDLRIRTCGGLPGAAYCDPGLNGVIACPCGNAPTGPGEGCSNSAGAGASMSGAGTASLAADTLVLSGSGIQSATGSCAGFSVALTCILLQGSSNAPGGLAFNDGVRCFSGALKRLQSASSVGGVFTSSVGISTTSATLGDPIAAGTPRYYGIWYRDACGSWGCAAPLNSNVTNSYVVLWNP